MYEPSFKITNQILCDVGVIEAAREAIETAALVPAFEAQFREEAMVRTVHFGTHVEGNDLTLAQAEKVVRQEPARHEDAAEVAERAGVVARARDVQEVINYRNVLGYIEELWQRRQKQKGVFGYSQEQLLTIQTLSTERVLAPHETGVFRKQQVVVRGVEMGEVVYRPPNAVEVPFQIEDFFVWLNKEETRGLHPVIKAGITQCELLRIHPFVEGNGRVARGMALLILTIEGIDARRFFSIEEHFDKSIKEYYRALKAVEDQGEMTPWLEYFAKALAVEMNKVKEKLKKLSVDARLRGRMGRQIALKERQIKLIEYMEKNEWLTMTEAREMLPMVSDDTILRDVKDLTKKGVIRKKGRTKGARYTLRI